MDNLEMILEAISEMYSKLEERLDGISQEVAQLKNDRENAQTNLEKLENVYKMIEAKLAKFEAVQNESSQPVAIDYEAFQAKINDVSQIVAVMENDQGLRLEMLEENSKMISDLVRQARDNTNKIIVRLDVQDGFFLDLKDKGEPSGGE